MCEWFFFWKNHLSTLYKVLYTLKHNLNEVEQKEIFDFLFINILNEKNIFSDGCLGSRNDEERSEMRYVMRIADLVNHQNFERTLHNFVVCLLECLLTPIKKIFILRNSISFWTEHCTSNWVFFWENFMLVVWKKSFCKVTKT